MQQIIKLIAAVYSVLAYLNIINELSIVPVIPSSETQIFKKLKMRLANTCEKKKSQLRILKSQAVRVQSTARSMDLAFSKSKSRPDVSRKESYLA